MIKTRRLLTALFAVFTAALLTAGGAWLLVDDATLVTWLVERVESASGTRISYRDDAGVTRTLTPALSLNELVIEDIEGKYRVEASSLLVQISLPYLLAGRVDIPQLLVGDTRVNITGAGPAKERKMPTSIDFSALRLEPVLHDVRVSELTLLFEGEKLQLPASAVSELVLKLAPGKDIPQLSARVELEGEKLFIDVTLPELRKAIKDQKLPFSVSVKGAISDSSAVGHIDFSQPDALVEASIRIRSPDLKKLPVLIEGLEIPGELAASGELAGTFSQLALEDMSVTWTDPGQSTVTLKGRVASVTDFSGVNVDLAGQLGKTDWLQPLFPDTVAPLVASELAVKVSGNASKLDFRSFKVKTSTEDGLDFSLAGQFDITNLFTTPQSENINLDISYTAPTTHAVRALLFDALPELGAITGSGEIHSMRGDPYLENIVVHAKDEEGISASLTGRIAQFSLDAEESSKGYALDVVINAKQASLMAERSGLDLPLAGPLNLAFRIEGDTQALQLNQLSLLAGNEDRTLISAKGHLKFRDWDQEDPLESIDLAFEMKGRSTGFLNAWAEQKFPAIPYKMRGRLHTVSGQHRIDDYVQNTPPDALLSITQTGRVEHVVFFPEFSLEGIHVDLKASTDDIATLNKPFNLDDRIPSIGPLDLSFQYSGNEDKLMISNFSLTAGRQDTLLTTVKGRLGYISAAKKWHLEDTDLAVTADSTSSQAFANAMGFYIPQLGAVSMTASLDDKDKQLGLKSIRFRVGESRAPILSAEGYIGDIYTFSKVRLDTELSLDGRSSPVFSDKQVLSDLESVTGTMVISDSDGSLGIDSIRIDSAASDVLSLNIDGSYDNFSDPETLLLNTHLNVRDMQLLGALFGKQWAEVGPVVFDAEVKKAGEDIALKAELALGKANVEVNLLGDFDTSPPYISGGIVAHNVFFKSLLSKTVEKKAQKKKKGSSVFSYELIPFNWLNKADLDIVVDVDSFDQDEWSVQSAKFVIGLKSGQLVINPAVVTYTEGSMDMELRVSARDVPGFTLKANAVNVNPWRDQNEEGSGYGQYADADYDLDLSLSASGVNAKELASSLDGEVYLTIQDGWMSRSMVDLLFVDLAGWSLNLVKDSKYSPINCGIADYSISRGVISTNAFFIDSKSITVTGEGTVDLDKEKVNYVFIPKKKSRVILKAEPVRIKGSLSNPSVRAVPVKSAALTFGTLIFAPYVFAGMVAADYASDAIQGGDDGKSACLKYEKKRSKARKK